MQNLEMEWEKRVNEPLLPLLPLTCLFFNWVKKPTDKNKIWTTALASLNLFLKLVAVSNTALHMPFYISGAVVVCSSFSLQFNVFIKHLMYSPEENS